MFNEILFESKVRPYFSSFDITRQGYKVIDVEVIKTNIERLKQPPSWEELVQKRSKTRNVRIEDMILQESSLQVLEYIQDNLNLGKTNNVLLTSKLLLDTSPLTLSNVREALLGTNIRAIIDFKLINHTRYINKYIKAINSLLPDAGIYIGTFESNRQHNARIYRKYPFGIRHLKIFIDFVIHRVIPKLSLTKRIYFWITKGKYRYISKGEVLGRLVSCGFEIIDFRVIRGLTYFVVMKTSEPKEINNPTYGPLIRLNRIGKNGKIIRVYKFRTMHPYSEFIQDFVVKMNGYTDKGKPAKDFRLTAWGKLFRKYWVDEFPQIINVLKGELKLVGVRPLSMTRFNELPPDIRVLRVREKPGCIPPYVALNMPSERGNIEAERIYFRDKKDSRLTDLRYFLMALRNILTRKIVSE